MAGKPWSPATRAKMAAIQADPEWREKIAAALTGHPVSDEARRKMSKTSKANWADPAYRAKVITARQAAMTDPAVRAKWSKASKAKWADTQYRATTSEAIKAAWADPGVRAKAAQTAQAAWADPEKSAAMRNPPILGECVYCGDPNATTYDHVIPRGRPGWDDPDNVVPCCFSCNSSKGQRTPDEWWAQMTQNDPKSDI